jgi:hypothetical protein
MEEKVFSAECGFTPKIRYTRWTDLSEKVEAKKLKRKIGGQIGACGWARAGATLRDEPNYSNGKN